MLFTATKSRYSTVLPGQSRDFQTICRDKAPIFTIFAVTLPRFSRFFCRDNATIFRILACRGTAISHQILKFIKNKRLPITVVFLPGIKLKELFCASRPYDRRKCVSTNCLICPRLITDRVDCSKMAPIYRITCNICLQCYIGESSRSLHDRLSEHLRFANNPTCRSYKFQESPEVLIKTFNTAPLKIHLQLVNLAQLSLPTGTTSL